MLKGVMPQRERSVYTEKPPVGNLVASSSLLVPDAAAIDSAQSRDSPTHQLRKPANPVQIDGNSKHKLRNIARFSIRARLGRVFGPIFGGSGVASEESASVYRERIPGSHPPGSFTGPPPATGHPPGQGSLLRQAPVPNPSPWCLTNTEGPADESVHASADARTLPAVPPRREQSWSDNERFDTVPSTEVDRIVSLSKEQLSNLQRDQAQEYADIVNAVWYSIIRVHQLV